ncbi:hypothetical protein EUX98_g8821 [Antrodiella citrinella]|uniref:Uncharacterized protein n=1 Tax=Antrodiella citrinella TaxID=2447956 RepID=A0A4S4M2D6_9APHY|nr:hypothetical protein EUX98_g8821 [Antrodiella citrinella]
MANKTDSQERLDKKTEPIKVDADEDRKPRTLDDMEKEATWLKEVFAKDEDDARNR